MYDGLKSRSADSALRYRNIGQYKEYLYFEWLVSAVSIYLSITTLSRAHSRLMPVESGAHGDRHCSQSSVGDNHGGRKYGDLNTLVMDEPHIFNASCSYGEFFN